MPHYTIIPMKVEDILTLNLQEDIKNVIDLDAKDESEVKSEIDSYILTESLAKHLDDFLDVYASNIKESGVWISGFYGSGKSYFAKMTGYLLDNPVLLGTSVRDRIVQKLQGLKNASFLEMKINGLDRFRSRVILFDVAKHDNKNGFAYMLFGNFLRSLGLLDNKCGFIEYDLLLRGEYSLFCQRVKEQTGKDWLQVRRSRTELIPAFRKALIGWKFTESEYTDTLSLIDDRIAHYDANKLKEDLEDYLKVKADEKVVFLFDEVSEALTQKKIDILQLEGLSEALSSLGQRVWTIAIAQEKLDDVVNSAGVSKGSLTKLTDRFKTKVHIDSQEVDVIIRQRLLAKTEEGKNTLADYYAKHSGLITDISNLSGSGLGKTVDAQMYVTYYPFYAHQFALLRHFLFGTKSLISSSVGARGMIISAFDVLKKESIKDNQLFDSVTSYSLCKQAQQQPNVELVNRYEYARTKLIDDNFKWVNGRKLLETIHFLTGAEVVKTTAENITKSYVSSPDQYHQVYEEVRQALKILVETKTLIESNNQFRITSQIEQRIIDEMNSWDVPTYRVKGEIVKRLKTFDVIKSMVTFTEEGIPYPFYISTDNDEPLSTNTANKSQRIVFHDLYNLNSDIHGCIQNIKEKTQNSKDVISLVPDVSNFVQIEKLIKEIERIDHIDQMPTGSEDEKKVKNDFLIQKGEKETLRDKLLREAYFNGKLIYMYNVVQLDEYSFAKEVQTKQAMLIDNIYTKRIKAAISDATAKLIVTKAPNQLHSLFTSEELRFFDSTGKFIGDNLSVVSEITACMKNHISGRDLEDKLKGAPTGYSFGVLICAVAALFRANKVITKYNGQDYYSVNDEGAADIFAQSKNFGKATFKAVSKSLSYNQKREIVDCLKELDCQKLGIAVSYNQNDFELVNAIRDFAREMLDKVKKNILGDEEMERLFKRSVQARSVFTQYTATVTEANYLATASEFLHNKEEFEKAVDRVEDDIRFIDVNLRQIKNYRSLIKAIAKEYKKAETVHPLFDSQYEQFEQMYSHDLVANYKAMGNIMQQVKDGYYQLIQHECERMTEAYLAIQIRADQLLQSLADYPEAWNRALKENVESLVAFARKRQCVKVDLEKEGITCRKCGLSLSEMVSAIDLSSKKEAELMARESSIVISDPKPVPPPIDPSDEDKTKEDEKKNLQPKKEKLQCPEYKLNPQLPHGKTTVNEYRKWLQQQLQILAGWSDDDTLIMQ